MGISLAASNAIGSVTIHPGTVTSGIEKLATSGGDLREMTPAERLQTAAAANNGLANRSLNWLLLAGLVITAPASVYFYGEASTANKLLKQHGIVIEEQNPLTASDELRLRGSEYLQRDLDNYRWTPANNSNHDTSDRGSHQVR